jgi:hypothetical protein
MDGGKAGYVRKRHRDLRRCRPPLRAVRSCCSAWACDAAFAMGTPL